MKPVGKSEMEGPTKDRTGLLAFNFYTWILDLKCVSSRTEIICPCLSS